MPNRRQFLQTCLAAAMFGPSKSKVVIARDPMLRGSSSSPESARVLKLLDRGVPPEMWKTLFKPTEVVGLKVNCLAGRGISTSVVLVDAIIERLQQSGVPAKNIVVWDRLDSDLERAGFHVGLAKSGIRYLGNDTSGYEDDLLVFGAVGSLMSKTLTRVCDAVINLPVLKDHGIVGATMALKNLFGAIHNPNKYHPNLGDPYVADVYMLPPIRQKVRLHICDGLTAQYEGGPSFMPQWTWPYNGLLVSRDPVALDQTAWQILERKRAEKKLTSLKEAKREPRYIATAADSNHRLGTNDPAQIEVQEI